MTDVQKMTQSKFFKAVLSSLGILIVALIVFSLGVYVGERRARYSYQWGANYERNFMGGPAGPMMGEGRFQAGPESFPLGMAPNFEDRGFRNGHGIAGVITSIAENDIIIKDRSGNENTVAVSGKTIIKDGRSDIKITDLKNDQDIVVIGNPDDNGVVNASLIRVFNHK